MKILYIGDIMAEMGIQSVEKILPDIITREQVDMVVAQAENVSAGKGMNLVDYERLKTAGVQAFTGGNHTIKDAELFPLLLDTAAPVVGPANMTDCPGPGYKLVSSIKGTVLVISLLGSIVGKQSDIAMQNPLQKVDEVFAAIPRESYLTAVVNFHGDYSSEKVIIGHYLDGRAGVVVGDHWHVPTADTQILPKGTAHMTDVGMCGSLDSSLGVTFESVIPRWRDGYQTRNQLATTGRNQFNALLIEIDEQSGRAVRTGHIREVW